jgi:hypothetical protein
MKDTALENFRRPPQMLNCAQSVLYAYQAVYGDASMPVSEMKPFGGGRAPGGLCGALHAACTIAPQKAEVLKSKFAATTGSTLCKELRETSELACQTCVSESARILQDELGAPPARAT